MTWLDLTWNLFSSYRFLCLGHLYCEFSLHLRTILHSSRYKLADKGMRFDNNNLCNSLRGVWRLIGSHDLGWGKHRPWAQHPHHTLLRSDWRQKSVSWLHSAQHSHVLPAQMCAAVFGGSRMQWLALRRLWRKTEGAGWNLSLAATAEI